MRMGIGGCSLQTISQCPNGHDILREHKVVRDDKCQSCKTPIAQGVRITCMCEDPSCNFKASMVYCATCEARPKMIHMITKVPIIAAMGRPCVICEMDCARQGHDIANMCKVCGATFCRPCVLSKRTTPVPKMKKKLSPLEEDKPAPLKLSSQSMEVKLELDNQKSPDFGLRNPEMYDIDDMSDSEPSSDESELDEAEIKPPTHRVKSASMKQTFKPTKFKQPVRPQMGDFATFVDLKGADESSDGKKKPKQLKKPKLANIHESADSLDLFKSVSSTMNSKKPQKLKKPKKPTMNNITSYLEI